MRNTVIAVVVLAVAMWFIVAAAAQHGSDRPNHMYHKMMERCPMTVSGAEVDVQDKKDGVALTFTAASGDVNELRNRVELMAKMHMEHMSAGFMPQAEQRMMVPAIVKYESVPSGGRLIFNPKNPADLQKMRDLIRQHAERLKKGDCSMMPNMMQDMGHAQ